MEKGSYTHRKTCRLCGSKKLSLILDLGYMPLAGDFIQFSEIGREKYYPLRIYACRVCSLVQVLDVIDPQELFQDYRYLSSIGLSRHFEEYAKEIYGKFLNEKSFVVEIGSNDGVLLVPLNRLGVHTLGVDPARNIVKKARARGVQTIIDYFGKKVGGKILMKFGPADAVLANNVLAHIDDMNDVFEGIGTILKDTGILVFEVHYFGDLLKKLQYDFLYNEHLCYYTLHSLVPFLEKYGMRIFDVKRMPIHSGSLRIYACRTTNRKIRQRKNVRDLYDYETAAGFSRFSRLRQWGNRVVTHRDRIREYLYNLKNKGSRIVGYGASGRGNTLLNFCGIGTHLLDYIVDESPERQNRYTPGTHIPIVSPEVFRSDSPSYALLLAWNYERMIVEKELVFIKKGGKFIVPLPRVKVVSK